MTRINPIQIANRIGRIVFATILAGIFAVFVGLPGKAWAGNLSTSPISLLFDLVMDITTSIALSLFIVPIALLILWTLPPRVDRGRIWKGFIAIAILFAGFFAWGINAGPVETVSSAVLIFGYACAVFLAIEIVEGMFRSRLAEDLTADTIVTASGVLVVAGLLTIGVIVGGAATVGAVADSLGPPEETKYAGPTQAEFEAQFSTVLDAKRGSDLTCGSGDLEVEREDEMPASKTYENGLSDWTVTPEVVEHESYEGEVYYSLVLEFQHEDQLYINEFRWDGNPENRVSLSKWAESNVDSTSYRIIAVDGSHSEAGLVFDKQYVEFDVVTANGSIERHTATLCG